MIDCVVAGVFGLLTLLHLAFFWYYPAQRANLYFAFFAGTMAVENTITFLQWALDFSTLEVMLSLQFMATLLSGFTYLWAMRALYTLFRFRTGWVYRGLWAGF